MRLLVVEDDPGMAALLLRGLRREGYAVDVVRSGGEALWGVRENAYDGILLDAMIPAPDGLEICARMRAEDIWTPVLMLTARRSGASRAWSMTRCLTGDPGGDPAASLAAGR